MSAMKTQLLYILLMAIPIASHGQQQWQIKVDGGYSVPLSKYGKVDVSQTISIVDGYPLHEYFDKEGHAAAEAGSYYTVLVKRLFANSRLVASAGFGKGYNPVNTTEISSYYTDYFDNDFYFVFEQDDYEVTYGFLSAGYYHKISKVSLTVEPLIGYSSMRYPDYKMSFYLKATEELRLETIHLGPTEDIGAIMVGVQSAVDFTLLNRLLIGISMRYRSANYDYTIEPKAAGIDSRKRDDTVNYRVFNVGISLGILL